MKFTQNYKLVLLKHIMPNKHIITYLAFLGFSLFFSLTGNAQAERVKAINDYILFTNENVHGMLIVHRILENLNQEVNKYVDLQSNQLNFYGNKDLPLDIFEDPDNWFYDKSPNQIKETLPEHSIQFNSEVNEILGNLVSEMTSVTAATNSIRFELEGLIKEKDLTLDENQILIFKKLESCEFLYDRFYETKENLNLYLESLVEKEKIESTDSNSLNRTFKDIQSKMKLFLEAWHFNILIDNSELTKALEQDIQKLKSKKISNRYLQNSILAAENALEVIKKFQADKKIPQKYDLYGKNYFYHNVELLSCLNKYGKGFTNNSNKFIKATDPNGIFNFEEPHFFKVIYPKKEIDIPVEEEVITVLPNKLEERKVVIKQQTIEVKEVKLYLEIFDHKQEDGDIVSLNFNGNWILKEKKIAKRPFKFLVELNTEGENYLLLHAENLGEIPPNTIAVRYYIDGRPKLVVLNSDLNQSEMIRIKMIN